MAVEVYCRKRNTNSQSLDPEAVWPLDPAGTPTLYTLCDCVPLRYKSQCRAHCNCSQTRNSLQSTGWRRWHIRCRVHSSFFFIRAWGGGPVTAGGRKSAQMNPCANKTLSPLPRHQRPLRLNWGIGGMLFRGNHSKVNPYDIILLQSVHWSVKPSKHSTGGRRREETALNHCLHFAPQKNSKSTGILGPWNPPFRFSHPPLITCRESASLCCRFEQRP